MKIVPETGCITLVMQIGKLHWLFGCGDRSLREVNNWYDHVGQEEGAALERYSSRGLPKLNRIEIEHTLMKYVPIVRYIRLLSLTIV